MTSLKPLVHGPWIAGLKPPMARVPTPVSAVPARPRAHCPCRTAPAARAAPVQRGMLVDPARLAGLSADFAQRTAALEAEIFALAGREFTIASPKQLAQARP